MTNQTLLQFKEAVDEEIQEYEAMEELYKLKQAVLIQCKADALWGIDEKIVTTMNKIKKINSKRMEAAKYLGNDQLTMTEAINKAQATNDSLADKLKLQKDKLNILSKSIFLYEKTNMDLVKHGLTLVNKKFDIIVNALLPQPNQYNNLGKNVSNTKIQLSSVQEDA